MKYFDDIERYLNGQMSTEEKAQFEERLKQDDDLKTAYRKHLEVYEALKDDELIRFRQKIENIGRAQKGRRKGNGFTGNKFLMYWLSAAAAIILLLASIYLIYNIIPGESNYRSRADDSMISDSVSLPDSYFELKNLVNRGVHPKSWQPLDSAKFNYGDPIKFRFGVEQDSNLILEVHHATDGLVYREETGTGSTLSMIEPLETGVYFYKVINSDTLLYIGYFIITE